MMNSSPSLVVNQVSHLYLALHPLDRNCGLLTWYAMQEPLQAIGEQPAIGQKLVSAEADWKSQQQTGEVQYLCLISAETITSKDRKKKRGTTPELSKRAKYVIQYKRRNMSRRFLFIHWWLATAGTISIIHR